jgi:hypothetical protein
MWVALRHAAAYLDVSPDTIGRWGIPMKSHPEVVPGKLRFKIVIGTGEKRYYRPDLDLTLE